MNVFTNENLGAIGIVVGIAGFVATLAIAYVNRQRKSLTWAIEARTPLVRAARETEGRLAIVFDGKEVKDADLALVRIRNSGNIPIQLTDFDKPVELVLEPKKATASTPSILSAEIVDSHPKDLGATVHVDGQIARITPLLLNAGDSVKLRIIGNSMREAELSLQGRIVGIGSFTKESSEGRKSTIRAGILTLACLAVVGALMVPTWQYAIFHYVMMPLLFASLVVFAFLAFKDPEAFKRRPKL